MNTLLVIGFMASVLVVLGLVLKALRPKLPSSAIRDIPRFGIPPAAAGSTAIQGFDPELLRRHVNGDATATSGSGDGSTLHVPHADTSINFGHGHGHHAGFGDSSGHGGDGGDGGGDGH